MAKEKKKEKRNEEMYCKTGSNAVGGVLIFFMIFCGIIGMALGMAENDYNTRVAAGEDFSSESPDNLDLGEWFDYITRE